MAVPMPMVRRIDFGYFVRPAQETGTGRPRVEGVLGYVIEHSTGLLLFDTGLGEGDAEADTHYRPVRCPLPAAMRAAGVSGAEDRQLDGETEILPGVTVIPTPGHTDGHQAMAVRANDGTVILAGQATNTAFDYE